MRASGNGDSKEERDLGSTVASSGQDSHSRIKERRKSMMTPKLLERW